MKYSGTKNCKSRFFFFVFCFDLFYCLLKKVPSFYYVLYTIFLCNCELDCIFNDIFSQYFLYSNPISSRSLLLSWRDSKYLMRWKFLFVFYKLQHREIHVCLKFCTLHSLLCGPVCFVITKSLQPWNSTFIKRALGLGNDWSSSLNVRGALIFAVWDMM